ncbi:MAG: AAA family ATPase [Proteobacteria bacterium]|nr:AAA family ATPase [Cystobacterineae bacterium]MCL2259065.1 AAA family ATPase [Cystobacterineae bacterium]MCL2314580.1 AAA family ATPase [Pseudomonadota bacterium]
METLRYNLKTASTLLGLKPGELMAQSRQSEWSPEEIWSLRAKLALYPPPVGNRKQLFLNFKGGTGKTSLSTSYAWRLAEMGYGVLLVDLDSQGHATKCLGFEGEDFPHTLLDVFQKKTKLSSIVQKTPLPNLEFVPSNLNMSTVDLLLMPMAGREFKLKSALKELESNYDFIVFDAPPSFGLLNLNALIASNDLIIPVLADFLSFHGLRLLFETLQNLEEDLGHLLEHIFIVVNAFNQTFKLAKEALDALKRHYAEYLMPHVIRQCTKFAQASSEGRPIFLADRDSKGAQDIQTLIQFILATLVEGSPSNGRKK